MLDSFFSWAQKHYPYDTAIEGPCQSEILGQKAPVACLYGDTYKFLDSAT